MFDEKTILIIIIVISLHTYACRCFLPPFEKIEDITIRMLSSMSLGNLGLIFNADLVNVNLENKTFTLKVLEVYKGDVKKNSLIKGKLQFLFFIYPN